MQQPLIPPGQQGMQPSQERSATTKQAYDILNGHKKLQLRQQRQWLEAMTGFEKNNKYCLRDEAGNDIFFVKENSTCMERTCAGCMGGLCKQWRMDIFLLGPQGVAGGLDSMTPFIHLERPCHATFCCLNRPEVVVTDAQTQAKIGTIREPFTFCNLKFEILNATDTPFLNVEACCCQPGLCCPMPCDGVPCQLIDFPITDVQSGNTVAHIQKKWRWGDAFPCAKEWDDYWIEFGEANNDFKVLFLATSIFIQMRFFDKRNQNNSNN